MWRPIACIFLLLGPVLHAFEVSRPEVIGNAPYRRSSVEMATNGAGYLVVWQDTRPDTTYGATSYSVTAVRGALLDEQGHPAAPHDFLIARSSLVLSVISNGSEYLVVTAEYHGPQWTGELRLNVVTTEGVVRTTSVVSAERRGGVALFGSIAATGGDYYAIFYRDGAPRIFVFDADLRELASDVEIAASTAEFARLFGTSDGRLLVSWRGVDSATRIAFVSTKDLAAGRFTTTSEPERLWEFYPPDHLIETDQGYLLTWSIGGLSTALVGRDGAVMENAREAYDNPAAAFDLRDAVVLPTAKGFLAVDSRALRPGPFGRTVFVYGVATRRLDGDRNAVGEFELIDDEASHVAAAPARGGGGLIAYTPEGTQEIRIRRVTPSGEIELAPGEVNAARSLPSQDDAVVKRCGDTSIIAWIERVGGAEDRVFYRRFDADLRPIDPPNTLAGTTTAFFLPPSLECGTSSALLMWPGEEKLHGLLFPGVNGTPRPQDLGQLTYAGSYPMIFDGTGYVIVRSGTVERWSENGELLLSANNNALFGIERTEIAWNGTEFLVSGARYDRDYPQIVARRLDRNFNRIGADIPVRSTGKRWWDRARIAAADGMWLVAWIEQEGVTYTYEPRSMRISSSGVPLDPDGGVVSGPKTRRLAVSANGSSFELLTEHAVTRRATDGRLRTIPLLDDDAWLLAIEAEGRTPLLVYWRADPVHQMRRLFAERIVRTGLPPDRDPARSPRP